MEHYALQIKRCMDPNCCTSTKLNKEELKRFPIPILDSNSLHYLPYDDAKLLKKADERDRPSLKIRKERKQPKNAKNVRSHGLFIPRTKLTTTNVRHWLRASQVLSIHAEHFYFYLIQSLKQQVLCVYAPHSNLQCKLKFLIMDRMLTELINAANVEGTTLLFIRY